jgi:hypothetical protein
VGVKLVLERQALPEGGPLGTTIHPPECGQVDKSFRFAAQTVQAEANSPTMSEQCINARGSSRGHRWRFI